MSYRNICGFRRSSAWSTSSSRSVAQSPVTSSQRARAVTLATGQWQGSFQLYCPAYRRAPAEEAGVPTPVPCATGRLRNSTAVRPSTGVWIADAVRAPVVPAAVAATNWFAPGTKCRSTTHSPSASGIGCGEWGERQRSTNTGRQREC